MPVTSATGASSAVEIVPNDKVGFSGLSAEDFMKLLVTQLQNQDPTEPVSNQDLIEQISSIRGLQANNDLSETLSTFAESQQTLLQGQLLTASASYIGKTVTATIPDPSDETKTLEVEGEVDRASVSKGKGFVELIDSNNLRYTVETGKILAVSKS